MKKILLTVGMFSFLAINVFAQTPDTANITDKVVHPKPGTNDATHDLAQALAISTANMISLPFQFNFNFGVGEYVRTQAVINFQPVVPFELSGSRWNVVNRLIIPIIQKPDHAESGSATGLGNSTLTSFFVAPSKGIFTWGFGPAFSMPTATDAKFGGDAFGIGPTLVMLWMPGHWVAGFTFVQTWSCKTSNFNPFFGQYFIIYYIRKGWFVNTSPAITSNFNADEGEQWTIPVNTYFGKIVHFETLPAKYFLQYYDYVV